MKFKSRFLLDVITKIFVSLSFCMEPIFTAIASYPLLGETLSIKGVLGAILIIIGTIIASIIPSFKEEEIQNCEMLTDNINVLNTGEAKI